jgi:hypothetical protein
MADLYNLDAELEQGMMGITRTDDTQLDNGNDDPELRLTISRTDEDTNRTNDAITTPMDDDNDGDVGGTNDEDMYPSGSNIPAALREAAMARQNPRYRKNAVVDDAQDYDRDVYKGATRSNADSFLLLEKPQNHEAELQKLPYTHLYQAWTQECHAPELLPYPYKTIQLIREGLLRYETYMDVKDDHNNDVGHNNRTHRTNENLNAMIDSLLRIDVERVKFLLSDLLKRRIQKITTHPQRYLKLIAPVHSTSISDSTEETEQSDNEGNHSLMCPAEVSFVSRKIVVVCR